MFSNKINSLIIMQHLEIDVPGTPLI